MAADGSTDDIKIPSVFLSKKKDVDTLVELLESQGEVEVEIAVVQPTSTGGNTSGADDQKQTEGVYSQTLLVSTWVSKYSWVVSTHSSVPTSCNTIESTLDSKYL